MEIGKWRMGTIGRGLKRMKWNDNFETETSINGKIITVGQQNFVGNTILIKEENGNVITCPMYMDERDDLFFVYDNTEVYLKWL